jgi:glutamine synthetase
MLEVIVMETIQKFVKERNIKMLDLKYVDLVGRWRHVTLPVSKLQETLFVEGVGFDGSSVPGFATVEAGDLNIIPDAATVFQDPFWETPTLSMICDVVYADTKRSYPLDPRFVAKKAEKYLIETGIADKILFNPELEFYVFDNVRYWQDERSGFYIIDSCEAPWSWMKDYPNMGYKITSGGYEITPPLDVFSNIRNEIATLMDECHIPLKYHHHEGGIAQQEIEIDLLPLLKAADAILLTKYIVRNVFLKHGKTVTFMPKPLYQRPGNGMHLHQCLFKGGKPLFYEAGKYGDLSETALYYIGGLLTHAPALTAFTNHSINSYKRLVPGFEAPVKLFFSIANRTACIRIPAYAVRPEEKRIEYRPPDATCNPYLALAAMLMAGIDGIQRKLDPTALGYGPIDKNIEKLSEEEKAKIKSLPTRLEESLEALEEDHDFLMKGGVFTKELIDAWLKYKMEKEVIPFRERLHPYEFQLYFDI